MEGCTYIAAVKVRKLHSYAKLNMEFCSELICWHTFVQAWNGLSILFYPYLVSLPNNLIQTDASGTWGCGAVFSH